MSPSERRLATLKTEEIGLEGMPYLVNETGSQTFSLHRFCDYNGGEESADHVSSKIVFSRKFSGKNYRNATDYKCNITMDPRFSSGAHFGQGYFLDIAGYRNSGPQNEPRRQRNSPSSIALDENLSRLFECMRLEYGT